MSRFCFARLRLRGFTALEQSGSERGAGSKCVVDQPCRASRSAERGGAGPCSPWPELRCGINDQPLTGTVQVRAAFEEFIVGDAQVMQRALDGSR